MSDRYGLQLLLTLLPYQTKRHTLSHTNGGGVAMQGAGLTIRHNLGFSILLKDSSTRVDTRGQQNVCLHCIRLVSLFLSISNSKLLLSNVNTIHFFLVSCYLYIIILSDIYIKYGFNTSYLKSDLARTCTKVYW